MHQRKILVVGSLNIDFVFKVQRLPKRGESLHGGEFSIFPGGKGANQAVAIAKLGGVVELVGRIGTDIFGNILLENLKKHDVCIDHIITDTQKATGTALIIIDKDGENSILVAQGANFNWQEHDIELIENLIIESEYLLLQLEIPFVALKMLRALAHKHNIPVVLDAGPAMPIKTDFLSEIAVVSPNETEAEALTGLEVNDLASASAAAHRILDMGARNVVMKLGDKGALVTDGKKDIHIPAVKTLAVDSTAAGDAFTAALVYFLSHNVSLTDAARIAAHAGALAVTKMGAQPSLPTADELSKNLRIHGYDFSFT